MVKLGPSRHTIIMEIKIHSFKRLLMILLVFGVVTPMVVWKALNSGDAARRIVSRVGLLVSVKNASIHRKDITSSQRPNFTQAVKSIGICPSENNLTGLRGNLSVNLGDITMSKVEKGVFIEHSTEVHNVIREFDLKLNLTKRVNGTRITQSSIQQVSSPPLLVGDYLYIPGGHWKPANCLPRWKVALIIPFRDRYKHLPIFLRHIVPMLQRQKLEFGIFVIEQNNQRPFNRAMLFNVGFVESLNFNQWDCFIFHDVDLLPYNDGNYYGCTGMPRHFISGLDYAKYKIHYATLFGGVTGLTREQMHKVNGLSNMYWGWGAEDDDFYKRVRHSGYSRTRPTSYYGWYDSIKHKNANASRQRMSYLNQWKSRHFVDGLNNLKYGESLTTLHPLYTNIAVNIEPLTIRVKT